MLFTLDTPPVIYIPIPITVPSFTEQDTITGPGTGPIITRARLPTDTEFITILIQDGDSPLASATDGSDTVTTTDHTIILHGGDPQDTVTDTGMVIILATIADTTKAIIMDTIMEYIRAAAQDTGLVIITGTPIIPTARMFIRAGQPA